MGMDKTECILNIYNKLMNDECVRKSKESARYNVTKRSIQRDIDLIRAYLEEHISKEGYINYLTYSHAEKGYRLKQLYKMKFTNSEILAVCKILLSS